MATIHRSLMIEAPAEKVFDIVDDPERLSTYVPNVSRVVDVKRSDQRLGDSFTVIYKVLGITFDEKFTVTEYKRPNRLMSTFEGGMKGTFTWTFEGQGEQTKTNIDVHYEVGAGAIGKAVDAILLERTNDKTIADTLENLRRIAAPQGTPSRP